MPRQLQLIQGAPTHSIVTPVAMSGNLRAGASPYEVGVLPRGILSYPDAQPKPLPKLQPKRKPLLPAFNTPVVKTAVEQPALDKENTAPAPPAAGAHPEVAASTSAGVNSMGSRRTATFDSGSFKPRTRLQVRSKATTVVTPVSPVRVGNPVVIEGDVPSTAVAAEDNGHIGNDVSNNRDSVTAW